MSRRATDQELDAARELAAEVRRRGGTATFTLDTALEAFEITRFTDASRDRITEALDAARLMAEPSIRTAKRGDLIAFTARDRVQAAPPVRPQHPPAEPVPPRPAGPKPPWYKRPIAIAAFCLLFLSLLVGALSEPEPDAEQGATATPTASPTPTPTPVSLEDAIAEADDAVAQDRYRAAIAAVTAIDDDGDSALVRRYKRKIARRILLRARRALRSGSNARAVRLAKESRSFHTFDDARAITVTADRRLAAARALRRERARLARIARDNRTCSSSERSTVRNGGGTPAGCTRFVAQFYAAQAEKAQEASAGEPSAGSGCEPGYSPCVPAYPPDVNCPEVGGEVSVTGSDPHGLDRDGDGVACGGD